ncbi:MAG: DUF3854 domain-containing protein, partial [Candidatus Desulfofervidaceae bacterium]|nr:DUF3854 domain-containing protein [Candidatus Desulfofervidaceae bacterium]
MITSEVIKADLEKSGLSSLEVEALGWYELKGSKEEKRKKLFELLGFTEFKRHDLARECEAILVIPYPRTKFCRVRFYPPIYVEEEDKEVKYLQPSKVPTKPYILDHIWELQKKPHKPLLITEGEKKAVCLCKYGWNAIGLPGVWNFTNNIDKNKLAPDLEVFNWRGRNVHIVYDSPDIYDNYNVRMAALKLSLFLFLEEANVYIVLLPKPKPKEKYGVDDFIAEQGWEAFKELYEKAREWTKIAKNHVRDIIKIISKLNLSREQLTLIQAFLPKALGLGKKDFLSLLYAFKPKSEVKNSKGWTQEEHIAKELLT